MSNPIYLDCVEVTSTRFSFLLRGKRLQPPEVAGENAGVSETVVDLAMSPTLVKEVAVLLLDLLRKYEAQWGTIASIYDIIHLEIKTKDLPPSTSTPPAITGTGTGTGLIN